MKVVLAGMNVPLKVLDRLSEEEREKATPEVLSAAYARISRSEKDVDALLDESLEDVSKARASNEAIIYGMGHHSVADHAMFNFNISGVSRLLVESIEKRRLAGYTEKSQRYVTLEGDYVRPEEFTPDDLRKFEDLVELQNDFYLRAGPKVLESLKRKFSHELQADSKGEVLREVKGSAREDARYSLCLATQAQLGCSYTGQTAELAIRELRYGRLEEERQFAKLLYDAIVERAPSIIQLADPDLFRRHNPGQELQDDNFKYTAEDLRELVGKTFGSIALEGRRSDLVPEEDVILVSHNDPDRQIITALLHCYSNRPMHDCCALADALLDRGEAADFIKGSLTHISRFDKVPRAFEAGFLIYELTLSASCFAQLKRHRMNTLLAQDYDPEVGCTIPQTIEESGLAQELRDICARSTELYNDFKGRHGKAAEYCLTNAHRRRVIVATNMRQLYHISRTREDKSAQWDIRDKASKMTRIARGVAPITSVLLGGQHEFDRIYKKVIKE